MSAITLAESLFNAGNVAGALIILRDSAGPGVARDFLLGRCCQKQGDLPEAAAAFSRVLAADPRHVEAASALGGIYIQLRWLDKAEAMYGRVLKKVDDDRLRTELAVALWLRKDSTRALSELSRVLARNPRYFAARQERAVMLMEAERFEEAADDFRFLIKECPERVLPWSMLGTLEYKAGRYEEALPLLQEAYRRQPGDGKHLSNLALAHVLAGHLQEGAALLERLRERDPRRWQETLESTRDSRRSNADEWIDPRPIFLLSAFQEQMICNWSRRSIFEEVFRDLAASPGYVNPLRLAHCAGIVPLKQAERRQLMTHIATVVSEGCIPFQHHPAPTTMRLRIGYVMPHLGVHVVCKILRELVAAHDMEAVEIQVFSTTQNINDYDSGMPESYRAIPGVTWVDLTALDDEKAAARIHAAGLDVVVDLAVYNDNARPGILARRPAPVQVSFLGAPFTSGAPWLDYIITDAVASPGVPGWCSEAEVRMPSSYFVYGHAQAEPPVGPARSRFGLPEDGFLFSALNNPYKIDPEAFDCWMRILAATPGSALLLKDGKGAADNLRCEAERRGVSAARLFFAGFVPDEDYLLRQGAPDLFLDTRLYGAHTTMAESLWMGVPGLSCLGDSFQSRVGASLLASCGLQELIAPDWDAYEAMAVELFRNRERLQALKARLAESRLRAAPYDMSGQARALEKAFRHMRERFGKGLAPASFDVAMLPG